MRCSFRVLVFSLAVGVVLFIVAFWDIGTAGADPDPEFMGEVSEPFDDDFASSPQAAARTPQSPKAAAKRCRADKAGGPADFCGSGGKAVCIDQWEKRYMKLYAKDLRAGLEILQRPGCFPHGVSISTMGYYRSGSTLLYNIVRLWTALAANGSMIAGFGCSALASMLKKMLSAHADKCTWICKDHEFGVVAAAAEVVLMSHRAPFYSVCSRKMMDVFCQTPPAKRKPRALGVDWEYVKEWHATCLADPKLMRDETVKQCHQLMQMQADVYKIRQFQQKGGRIAYDMALESWDADPAREVQAIGRAIGICDEAASDPALVRFLVQMGKTLKNHADLDIMVTRMHTVHTDEMRQTKCEHLEEYMRSDDTCSAWMDAFGSPAANALMPKAVRETLVRRPRSGKGGKRGGH